MKIEETKSVWVAWTNTDRMEGRGQQVPKAVCETLATALRVGKQGYVQGRDCPVTESFAAKVDGVWLMPWIIESASKEDIASQERTDAKLAAIAKAKEAGFSDDELELLSSQD